MSDNRKYYYLKLKENYFDEDAIVLLESMHSAISCSHTWAAWCSFSNGDEEMVG